jgi:sec-independent protein translocase protein TatA
MSTPSPLLFLGDLGASEIILILVIILIFFGAKRIPELARGLGTGIREFKSATSEVRSQFERTAPPRVTAQPPVPTAQLGSSYPPPASSPGQFLPVAPSV